MSVWDLVDEAYGRAGEPVPDVRLEVLRARVHGQEACRYVRFLHRLALAFGPLLAVELGTQWGITSAFLHAAGARVVGVDDAVEGRHLPLGRAGFTFLRMDSLDAAAVVGAMGEVGLLFQDTRPEGWEAEWEAYRPLMAPGGLWVCGDVALHPSWGAMPGEKREYAGLRGARVLGVVLL